MPGPPPKPADKRARRNKDLVGTTTVEAVPSGQPPLLDSIPWPEPTREWWCALGQLPQTQSFNAVQWDHLMMIAVIHADFWGNQNTRVLNDFQKAMAEYPILPASMLRLRVTALTGDEMQEKKDRPESKKVSKAKSRYATLKPGDLKAVPDSA
ncbi:hypothetical protein [Kocuria massiliensis]|uniref:phage terminase small subunit n=1 Tax=Kocuria massiliensis TaxID=1926282 RepID=UPI0022B97AFA|nr:hypothetical protein [Kocuria massiliensis]